MVSALLAIIDRLIQLRSYRRERIDKAFKDLFEPLFNDLLAIHGDYIKIFSDVLDILPTKLCAIVYDGHLVTSEERAEAFGKAVATLRTRRKAFEPIRVKFRAVAAEIDSIQDEFSPDAQEFIRTAIEYFPQGNVETHIWPPSPSLVLLEYLDAVRTIESYSALDEKQSMTLYEHANRVIRHNIALQETAWSNLCIAFARLRISSATSDYVKAHRKE
jgi:hypothetical protein